MARHKNNNPIVSQKTLRRWHRWVGYSALILVLILSITGLILNRTEKFNLNNITVNNPYILSLYGLSPKTPPVQFKEGPIWLSWLDGRLYLNSTLIGQNTDLPLGIAAPGKLIIVASKDHLSLYSADGSLIETLGKNALPGQITALGITKTNKIFIESGGKNFIADENYISWQNSLNSEEILWSHPQAAPKAITEQILQDFQGQGVSLYKIILDLHSGNIFGSLGSYLMDLAAISLIFLCFTGLMKRRPNNNGRRNKK